MNEWSLEQVNRYCNQYDETENFRFVMVKDEEGKPVDERKKWKCNACLEAENTGANLPCTFANPIANDKPTGCPHSHDECEWEEA